MGVGVFGGVQVPDNTDLIAVAGIAIAVGVAVFIFRVQREIQMHEVGERTWVAVADWLAIAATIVSLLFVILPIVAADPARLGRLPAAATAMAVLFAVGYFPAILAHYRLIFSRGRQGPRDNPEPAEARLVLAFGLIGIGVFVFVLLGD